MLQNWLYVAHRSPLSRPHNKVPKVRILLSPPRSLNCRESRLSYPRNTRYMPVFRDYSLTNRTPENGLLRIDRPNCPGFSLKGTSAVRFQGGQANAMRSEAGDSTMAS